MAHTFVIAEIGSCHDRDYDKLRSLIVAAARAGADAVKLQWVSSAERLLLRRGIMDAAGRAKYLPAYQLLQFPEGWLGDCAIIATTHGIRLLSSVYLPEDVLTLLPFVRMLKVASFEARDRELLDALLAAVATPVIVSTGMGTVDDVRWLATASPVTPWAILHCVSTYPCPVEDANLGGIRTVQKWAGPLIRVGYSDHTARTSTGGYAVAAGASVVEAHLRLPETDQQNLDRRPSLLPEEFDRYVEGIRYAERLLGDGEKRPQASEAAMLPYRVRG